MITLVAGDSGHANNSAPLEVWAGLGLVILLVFIFVTKACAKRTGAAASVERRRRERRTLLAGAAGELAGVTRARQARPSNACTFSDARAVGL